MANGNAAGRARRSSQLLRSLFAAPCCNPSGPTCLNNTDCLRTWDLGQLTLYPNGLGRFYKTLLSQLQVQLVATLNRKVRLMAASIDHIFSNQILTYHTVDTIHDTFSIAYIYIAVWIFYVCMYQTSLRYCIILHTIHCVLEMRCYVS